MRVISLHLFLFLLLQNRAFSQSSKQSLYLQIAFANNLYLKPVTQTQFFSPSLEVNMLGGTEKEQGGTSLFFLSGLSYNYNQQVFNVLWAGSNTNKPAQDKFYTNEFLFNWGMVIKYKLTKISVDLSFVFQGGPNYTWTDDPNAIVRLYRCQSKGLTFSSGNPLAPFDSVSYNIIKTRQTAYKWEYLQFYFTPGVQFTYRMNEKISILLGIKPRFFIYKEYLGTEFSDNLALNYSPLKIALNIALQIKLSK